MKRLRIRRHCRRARGRRLDDARIAEELAQIAPQGRGGRSVGSAELDEENARWCMTVASAVGQWLGISGHRATSH